jgi:cytochrome b
MTERHLVYDLPTRVFHVLFATLFIAAYAIANLNESESGAFPYHMLLGLTLTFLVCWRVLWGIMGTQHARFSGFALRPTELFHYLKSLVKGANRRWAGHNPASSWGGVGMMALGLLLGTSGIAMTYFDLKPELEEVHALLAHAFMVLVGAHVLGIAFHTFKHRDAIALSMIDGKKQDVVMKDQVQKPHKLAGIFLVLVVALFGVYVFKNYDAASGQLKILTVKIQLSKIQY